MEQKKITAKVFRFDPTADKESHFQDYEVPFVEGMSAMNALDYIYQNLDGSLAYYDHAGCALGICARCTGKVNGKAGLFCQIPVEGDVRIEPVSTSNVVKDLVIMKKQAEPKGDKT
jgi:succinate dehydrogenase/fumarate reductase-like Fe-S protein